MSFNPEESPSCIIEKATLLLDLGLETQFWRSLINPVAKAGTHSILRFVFTQKSGWISRSDFLSYRFTGAHCVSCATSFLGPLSSVSAADPTLTTTIRSGEDLTGLLQGAIGVIFGTSTAKRDMESISLLRQDLDDECLIRLSVPWIADHPLSRTRVFWVQGRADIESSRQFYEAAKALGITLVVLDQPGHWLEDDNGAYAHYREAFIPVSVDGDAGLTQRIVDAVKSYPYKVDGIVSISDVRLPLVAKACDILGLPTSSPEAYALAGDKGATRQLEDCAASAKEGFVLNSISELEDILDRMKGLIRFPLIVKPCSGWNSDCVRRVTTQEELYDAVRRASSRHASSPNQSTKVVVEPYIEGPEIDANFVILDGEVLFCDISDDFPCSGDRNDPKSLAANFMETLMDVPTDLPVDEQRMMKDALTASIKRLGFRTGIFHCEARVRNSRAQYHQTSDGFMDLKIANCQSIEQSPSCYLHEVNARSPGYVNCVAALLAYGIDYYAIRLLMSLGPCENERVRKLSQPFRDNKPQYTLGVVVLPPVQPGIMASEDAIVDFLKEHPELDQHVVHHQTIIKKGDLVRGPDSPELWCIGYITVASREGRRECLKLASQVQRTFKYKIVSS